MIMKDKQKIDDFKKIVKLMQIVKSNTNFMNLYRFLSHRIIEDFDFWKTLIKFFFQGKSENLNLLQIFKSNFAFFLITRCL